MYMPQILTLTLQMTQYIALTRFVRETSKKVKREARQKSEKNLGIGEGPPQPPLGTSMNKNVTFWSTKIFY